jgi:hypothetical protein
MCGGLVNAAPLTLPDLCGQWLQELEASNGKTCVQTVECGCSSSCPRVTQSLSFNTLQSRYVSSRTSYGSSSCLSNVNYDIEISGAFVLGTETRANYTGIRYTPDRWKITPYTGGANFAPYENDTATCFGIVTYLNTNCPCNGTWANGVTRNITLSQCPSGSCNETALFNNSTKYGNVRLYEDGSYPNATSSNVSKLLVLTVTDRVSTIGYNQTAVDFLQKPGCGPDCRSCDYLPTGPVNCTACCKTTNIPNADGGCRCPAGQSNNSSEPDKLKCVATTTTKSAASIGQPVVGCVCFIGVFLVL